MPVLGIETSCDETACAIYDGQSGLLSHVLHTQTSLHAEYGGVVPELASRDHIRRIEPLVRLALASAETSLAHIEAVAYTAGPGLIGALMVGASAAAGIACALGRPLVPIHHMEGHLLAPMLELQHPEYPFTALLVSGGHTLLVDVAGVGRYTVLGESIDDAAGEAFDKTAKVLGLPYPGGPNLALLAERGRPGRFRLPRPMTDRAGLDFSFSGLKTAVITALPPDADEQTRADMAHAFEEAVVETLVIKCRRALEHTGNTALVVAGGVGSNRKLRARLAEEMRRLGARAYFPRTEFCTDNAAMIAYAGWARRAEGRIANGPLLTRARWPLDELQPPA